jgi:hypothetical protein
MDHHPGAIDIRDLEVDTFPQVQPALVDGAQADPIVGPTQAAQDAMDFFTTQKNR